MQIRQVIGNVATVGATISVATLSFCGMLVLTSSVGWGFAAFFLAAAIEGAVYRENIFSALKKLGHQKTVIEKTIANRELKKLKTQHKDNVFIKDWVAQQQYLHELSEDLAHYQEKDRKKAEAEIARVTKRLEKMTQLFIQSIKQPNQPILPSLKNLLPFATITKQSLQQEVNKKNRLMNVGLFVALGSGICAGLVTLAGVNTSLLTMGMSAATIMAASIPIVSFAAIGYAFLMYHTLTDIIKNIL